MSPISNSFKSAFGLAILVVVFQVGLLVLIAKPDFNPKVTYPMVVFPPQWEKSPPSFEGWLGRYRRLNNWDSFHYLSIAEFGYTRSSEPIPIPKTIHSYQDNEAFFPVYPLLAGTLSRWSHVSPDLSLLLTAQLMAVVVWTYFLLILDQGGVLSTARKGALILALAFPSTFYLVVGYSESVFLAGLLGLVYWYRRLGQDPRVMTFLLCGLHGILVTGSRLVGLPLAILPFIYEMYRYRNHKEQSWKFAAGVSLLSSLGSIGYFIFNQLKFGQWNLPFVVQKIGWGNKPQFLAPFYPKYYFPNILKHSLLDLSHELCIPIFFGLFIWTYKSLRKIDKSLQSEAWIWFTAAGIIYYISFIGKAENSMTGMIRYILPVYFLLVILWSEQKLIDFASIQNWKLISKIGVLVLMTIQIILMTRYLNGLGVS